MNKQYQKETLTPPSAVPVVAPVKTKKKDKLKNKKQKNSKNFDAAKDCYSNINDIYHLYMEYTFRE